MRDYSTISPRFWIGHTGKKIKAMGADATIVALYLMTSPHANMLGLYYLPKYYLSHETGLTLEGASKGLQCCIEADFCTYDDASEVVWIFEMARLQLGEQLKPTDKRVIGIQNIYDKLPENPFLPRFYDKYLGLFSMQHKREDATVTAVLTKAPSKPLRSQEQEQDKEQEQETEHSPSLRSGEAHAKKKSEPQNRVTRLPDDWEPSEKARSYGRRLGYSDAEIDGMAEDIRLWAHSTGSANAVKRDWEKTFMGWMRRELKKPPARAGPNGHRPRTMTELASMEFPDEPSPSPQTEPESPKSAEPTILGFAGRLSQPDRDQPGGKLLDLGQAGARWRA